MDWKAMTNVDPSVIEAMKKSKESLVLREPITLDELYSLMEQGRARFPGDFKLKKGLFGASIVFKRYMDIGAKITTKENTVIVKRTEVEKNVNRNNRMSISKMADIVQTTQSVIHTVKTGEVSENLMGGANYFKGICEVMHELLQSRME